MSVVILQDELVHYEVLGRGKPLIFLHGWVGSWRYWIPSMQRASMSFRTYALDLWGFGDTAKAANLYTLDNQVDLLNMFLQEMGIQRVALIGHGLGAVVGVLFAARYQFKVVDRVMAIGLPNGQHTVNPRLMSLTPDELADWLLNRSVESEAARSEAPKADQHAIQRSIANLQRIDITALAQALTTPCLLIYGQNDPAIEESEEGMDIEAPEHLHSIVFEQSGHFPMLDEPTKFNRLLADFLQLASGASPRQLTIKDEWKRRVR